MPTLTLNPTANSGPVVSKSVTNYSTARAGTETLSLTSSRVGQSAFYDPIDEFDTWECYELFVEFNTTLNPGETLNTATLKGFVNVDLSTTDFVMEVCHRDFGAAVDTADFVAGAALLPSTLAASLSTTAITIDTLFTFTNSGTVLKDGVNTSGMTRLLISSDRHRLNTAPVADVGESVIIVLASCELVLDYTAADSGPPSPRWDYRSSILRR